MQSSSVVLVVVLLSMASIALCAPYVPPPQANLYPVQADGFETVVLDDMSYVNEINVQSTGTNWTNITFYAYGNSAIRTVITQPSFYVGATPNQNWHLPFIDFHTFLNGTDIWGIGPINALYGYNRTAYPGFQFQIAVITTQALPNNTRGRMFVEQPLGFEGTFYSVRVVGFDFDNVIGYFCGFFPPANSTDPTQLNFGVRRAHFNVSLFTSGDWTSNNAAWYFNPALDDGIIIKGGAQFVSYNTNFKPMLFHARNVSQDAPINSTWLVVVDPYMNMASLIMGNYDQSVPLNFTGWTYVPVWNNSQRGQIASGVVYQNLLFVGVSMGGLGTGWIDVLYLSNLTRRASSIPLPANYSNPKALVLDYFDPTPTIYIGCNGGGSILKFDINSLSIVGYQPLPGYLHNTWSGSATQDHVYFVTNEQHSKIYRVAKTDFCSTSCMANGYCSAGKCVCSDLYVENNGVCEFRQYWNERTVSIREKGGEVALGVLFALTTIAAAVGWYLVWRNRRGYQPV